MKRLDDRVVPEAYDLRLNVNPNHEHFSGNVSITVFVKQSNLTCIELHAHETLDVQRAQLMVADRVVSGIRATRDRLHGTLLVSLPPGSTLATHTRYVLSFSFSGRVSETSFVGLYRCWAPHADPTKSRSPLLCTQLQSAHASKVFPCWEEPSMRASVQLTVCAPEEYQVFSNAPLHAREGSLSVFERTPPMCVYLLGVVVGSFCTFERTVALQQGACQLRVQMNLGVSSAAAEAELILQEAERSLKALEAYTACPYGLSKLDIVAIPSMDSEAMENWGCICVRSDLLSTEALPEEQLRNIICHEIVHQWFGNNLSIAWWDDLWLNEGFATFFSLLLARAPPEAIRSFNQTEKAIAMRGIDQGVLTRVERADGADASFNEAAYIKGAALLQWLQTLLREGVFQQMIREYVRRFSRASVTNAGFWELVAEFAPPTSNLRTDLLRAWVADGSTPVVIVRELKHSFAVTQACLRDLHTPTSFPILVPGAHPGETQLLDNNALYLSLESPADERLYFARLLELQQKQYFRISIPDALLRRRMFGALPCPLDWSVLEDVMAFGRLGAANFRTTDDLLQVMFDIPVSGKLSPAFARVVEDVVLPWMLLATGEKRASRVDALRSWTAQILNDIGWDERANDDACGRPTWMSVGLELGNEQLLQCAFTDAVRSESFQRATAARKVLLCRALAHRRRACSGAWSESTEAVWKARLGALSSLTAWKTRLIGATDQELPELTKQLLSLFQHGSLLSDILWVLEAAYRSRDGIWDHALALLASEPLCSAFSRAVCSDDIIFQQAWAFFRDIRTTSAYKKLLAFQVTIQQAIPKGSIPFVQCQDTFVQQSLAWQARA